MQTKLNYLLALIIILMGIYIGSKLLRSAESRQKPKATAIYRDTIYKVVKSEPIILEKVRTKLIRRADTIIKSNPFTARLDTIYKRDTIRLEYRFPENDISLRLGRTADTIPYINELSLSKDESKWWEGPLYTLGGVIIGYIIGRK